MKVSSNGRHSKNGAASLEERVAQLEAEVERLKSSQPIATGQGWQSIVGSHADNPFFEQVVREMKRERDEDYAQARREARKTRKPQSKRRVARAK